MIIFKDIFSGDELFTDVFKYQLVDNMYYHIEGHYTQEREDGGYDIGANPSAEEEEEGTEAQITYGIDVCLSQRLVEVGVTKGTYKTDIRAYAKRLVEKIKETDEKRAKFVKENLGPVITKWLSYFDNATLYKGESMHENGTYVLCKYPEGDLKVGSQIDVFVLKDAVEEEKC